MKNKPSESLSELLTEAGRNNFVSFLELVNPDYEAQWFHEKIGEKLQENFHKLEQGISSRLVIEVPPQHGKSHEATINFPAWALGHHPEWPIITASYTSELAVKFGYKTRQIIDSQNYRAIFNTRVKEDSRAKGNWLTSQGGGYMSRGIGGSTTGSGFRIGIIDDPFKDRQEAESALVRDRVWDWYTSVFMTRQQGPTMVVVINTRWHLDDLVARIEKLESQGGEEWEYLTFPAIAEEDDKNRKKGEALWPSRFPLSFLEEAKRRSFYDFSSLYQQRPISQEHQVFKRESFKYFTESDIKFRSLDCVTMIDPAISDALNADNWVVLTIGKEKTSPNIYRLEESAGKGNPDKMLEAIFYHQGKYNSKVWLETISFQKILKRDVKELQRQKQQYFQIYELRHAKRKTKIGRIQALVPLYMAGVMYHREDDIAYEEELLEFPFGRHDDRCDACSFLNEALFDSPTDFEGENYPQRLTQKPTVDPY